jgi:NMD protein affecting ribosome stability and mRNA decay
MINGQDVEKFIKENSFPCVVCGEKPEWKDDLCKDCYEENTKEQTVIDDLIAKGHTEHCAKRITWGDGECECSFSKSGE